MKKWFTLLVICLFMVSALATPALAQEKNKYLDTERYKILQSVAYFSIDSSGEKYSEQLVNNYLQMSNAEFKKAVKSNLENVKAEINKGSKIYWNKDFVEKTIKSDFPEIYNGIALQVKKQEEVSGNIVTAAFTPDSAYRLFQVYGQNGLGWRLFGLSCRVDWSWDSVQLTNVTPYTWGEVFAPTWEYKGLTYSRQTQGSTSCNIEKKGQFVSSIQGTIIQTAYLWLNMNVYAGGGSNYTSGGS